MKVIRFYSEMAVSKGPPQLSKVKMIPLRRALGGHEAEGVLGHLSPGLGGWVPEGVSLLPLACSGTCSSQAEINPSNPMLQVWPLYVSVSRKQNFVTNSCFCTHLVLKMCLKGCREADIKKGPRGTVFFLTLPLSK